MEAKRGWDRHRGDDRRVPGTSLVSVLCHSAAEHCIYLDRQPGGFLVLVVPFHGLATVPICVVPTIDTRTREYLLE